VEAFTGQIRGWLEEGKVDLGIMHDLGVMRNLASRRLATEELYLVGPPGRYGGLDSPPSVAPSALAELSMILPGRQHGLRQLIEQEAKRLGTSISVRIEIDAMMHVPLLIATGEGYSILPLPAIRDELKAGRISIARIGDGAIRRTVCLVRNSNQVVTKASARCEDLTAKVLMSLIERGAWSAERAAT
jgi:LysR family nitrogen assimilation transcriptional regulator